MNTNLRLPDEMHAALKASAEKNHRSLNSEILNAIEFYLNVSKIARVDEPKKDKQVKKYPSGS